jgi:FkbM family methyltransferase
MAQRGLGLPRYLDLFARYRMATSRWDPRDAPFREFLRRLPRDGLVLDVGANVGVMTARLARHLARGAVHAFEPNPVTRAAAERLCARLGLRNVVFHDCALGREPGEVDLVMPEAGRVQLHGLSRVASGPAGEGAGRRFRVACRALDGLGDYLAPDPRVTGIKLDAEDAEADVLEGASRLLERHRPLVYCELWLSPNRDRAVALMRGLGYAAAVYRRGTLEPFAAHAHASDQDFFFTPGAAPDPATSA